MSDFDFDKIGKRIERIHRIVWIAAPIAALLGLALLGGLVYVAIHFLAKVW